MRILVVEDEKRIADFLSRGLESGGYAVDVAHDGAHAIDMVHATEYDLMILDLGLPDMDGLTVLQKIRNRKTSPPVLILSARDRGGRSREGSGRRRRRLSGEAVRLRGTAGARAGAAAARAADAGAAAGGRSDARLHPAQSDAQRAKTSSWRRRSSASSNT